MVNIIKPPVASMATISQLMDHYILTIIVNKIRINIRAKYHVRHCKTLERGMCHFNASKCLYPFTRTKGDLRRTCKFGLLTAISLKVEGFITFPSQWNTSSDGNVNLARGNALCVFMRTSIIMYLVIKKK